MLRQMSDTVPRRVGFSPYIATMTGLPLLDTNPTYRAGLMMSVDQGEVRMLRVRGIIRNGTSLAVSNNCKRRGVATETQISASSPDFQRLIAL